MVTIYYQNIWFEGDEYQIRFSDTSLNDQDEMPGMQLLEIDGMDKHQLPSRLWEFAEKEMDTNIAMTAEELYRW